MLHDGAAQAEGPAARLAALLTTGSPADGHGHPGAGHTQENAGGEAALSDPWLS